MISNHTSGPWGLYERHLTPGDVVRRPLGGPLSLVPAMSGIELADGKSFTFRLFKSKKGDAPAGNKLLELANQQKTFGAALAAVGIKSYNTNKVVQLTVNFMLDQLWEADVIGEKTYRTVEGALFGYPDEEFIPGGWTTAVLMGTVAPIGIVHALYESQYQTLQEYTGFSWRVSKALDWIAANTDPVAADLLADAIVKQQESYSEKYHTPFLESFAKSFWRGAKKAIQALVDAGADLADKVSDVLPWWVKVAIAGGVAFGLYSWLKRPGG